MLYLVGNNKADQYLSLKKFREKFFLSVSGMLNVKKQNLTKVQHLIL